MEDARILLKKALIRVGCKLERALKPSLKRFDLSGPEYEILYHLGRESLTLSELSQRLLKVNSNTTVLIDNLEARGLVRRLRDQRDRRIVRVRLTEAGTKLRDEAVLSLNHHVLDLLAGLADAEIDELLRLLARVEKICEEAPLGHG